MSRNEISCSQILLGSFPIQRKAPSKNHIAILDVMTNFYSVAGVYVGGGTVNGFMVYVNESPLAVNVTLQSE